MSNRRTITLEEFHAALQAQGVPQEHYAFKCVACGHVQSFASLAGGCSWVEQDLCSACSGG